MCKIEFPCLSMDISQFKIVEKPANNNNNNNNDFPAEEKNETTSVWLWNQKDQEKERKEAAGNGANGGNIMAPVLEKRAEERSWLAVAAENKQDDEEMKVEEEQPTRAANLMTSLWLSAPANSAKLTCAPAVPSTGLAAASLITWPDFSSAQWLDKNDNFSGAAEKIAKSALPADLDQWLERCTLEDYNAGMKNLAQWIATAKSGSSVGFKSASAWLIEASERLSNETNSFNRSELMDLGMWSGKDDNIWLNVGSDDSMAVSVVDSGIGETSAVGAAVEEWLSEAIADGDVDEDTIDDSTSSIAVINEEDCVEEEDEDAFDVVSWLA